MNTLHWNEQKSIVLSRVLVGIFTAAVIVLDGIALYLLLPTGKDTLGSLIKAILQGRTYFFSACCLLCSGFAYLLLYRMNLLLKNLQKGLVFIPENTSHLRIVSWCCFAASLICLVFAFWLPTVLAVTLTAGFVGLIVRIVKNVFENAIVMKDELDFTV